MRRELLDFHSIGFYVGLLTLGISAVVFVVPALAQEEYVITATLQSPEPKEGGGFGWLVGVSGDTVVVSEPGAEVGGKHEAGRAYIFDFRGNLLATLQSPTPEEGAQFAFSVAAGGGVVVVGEPTGDVEGTAAAGKVHVFDSEGNLLRTLQSPTPQAGAHFGYSVDVSGDTIVVGELQAEVEGKREAGRAYIFDSEGNLLATLQSPEPGLAHHFGNAAAVSGNTVVVGADRAMVERKRQAGRAHVFDREGNLLATLQSPKPGIGHLFGWAVSVSDDTVVVGAVRGSAEGPSHVGAAYIFDSEGNLLRTLQPPTLEPGAHFGALDVSGDTIVVGEFQADVGDVSEAGKAYIFDFRGNLLATLQSPTPQKGAWVLGYHLDLGFGWWVAVSGDVVVVSEPAADVGGVSRAGRAYIIRATRATFALSRLTVDPSSFEAGGTVTISVEVSNTGGQSGPHTVTLRIDGEVVDEKTVTLNPDETETVSFDVSATEEGTHSVEVNGLSASYTVTPKTIVTPTTTETTTHTTTTPPPAPIWVEWWLWAIIVVAVVLLVIGAAWKLTRGQQERT